MLGGPNLKVYLKPILSVLIVTVLGGAIFVYLTFSGRINDNPASDALLTVTRPFPALTGARDVTLRCSYHGSDLAIQETLYSSLADYYRADPKKKINYFHNDNAAMVFTYAKDRTVSKLASDIEAQAKLKGLDDDQTLDLASCFLQSIPYDNAKAAKILSPNSFQYSTDELIPRFPYETLYDFTGICTDKSYLGALVYKDLGYRSSLLVFDKERHMSIGVGVPMGYGDFGTDYAIMELTGQNFLVGDIPRISGNQGLAVNTIQAIPSVDTPASMDAALTNLSGNVKISGGKNYVEIVDRIDLKKQLTDMRTRLDTAKSALDAQKSALSAEESKLQAAESYYKANPTTTNYNSYLVAYNRYIDVYNSVQTQIASYNSLITDYNTKVSEYRKYS